MAARKDLTLTTDIIVGFSGETDDDFAETLDLVRRVGFPGLFGFKSSPRPYTPALKLDDDVPDSTKGERLCALFALSEELLQRHLVSLVGTSQVVLVEGQSKTGSGRVTGRTVRNEIVHLDDDPAASLVGELVDVRIVRAFKHSLKGEPTESFRAHRPKPALHRPRPRTLPMIA